MNNQNSEQNLLKKFIGPRSNYYLKTEVKQLNFHFAGLLFGNLWLLYRKMYFNFFIVLAWSFIVAVILGVIGIDFKYIYWVSFIPNIIFFIYGKRIYLSFAVQRVQKHLSHPKYSEEVFLELGRTNWSVPILFLFIQIVVTIMLSLPYIPYSIYSFG